MIMGEGKDYLILVMIPEKLWPFDLPNLKSNGLWSKRIWHCCVTLCYYSIHNTTHVTTDLNSPRAFFLIVWCDFFNRTFLIWTCSFAFCYNKVKIFFFSSTSKFITLNVRGSNVQFTITYFSCFCAAVFFLINGIKVDHLQIKHKNWILHLLPFIIA